MTASQFDELEVLFDAAGSEPRDLDAVEQLYGGPLALGPDAVFANFVASIDGVAAIRSRPRSSADISGGNAADRFVMGALRASADAILVGAGTIRAHPDGRWTADAAYPPEADAYRAMRVGAGDATAPRLVVVTGSGDVDPGHPGLDGALVATTVEGARAHAAQLEGTCEVVAFGEGELDLVALIRELRDRGARRILTEGGPTLLGALLRAGLVDTMFLTVSPVVAGRVSDGGRPGIVDGVAFDPSDLPSAGLTSVRRSADHLFLRYDLERSTG